MVFVHCRCWAAAICGCAVAVRGVAAVSLLLLPLCVDGELVCAEGCRQVTGVMAMMMTGRVLLVCALCVLWCGAGGGYALFFNDEVHAYYYGANGTYCKAFPTIFCSKTTEVTSQQNAAGGSVTGGNAESGEQENAQSIAGLGGEGSGEASDEGSAGRLAHGSEGSGSGRLKEDEGKAEELNQPGGAPPSPPATPPAPTGPINLPKSAEPGEPATSGVTTEVQSAQQPPPQSQLPAEEAPPTAAPIADGSSGGQEQTSEKNGSDQSEGATGTQLQKPGEGGTETSTPTVTAAHSADGQGNSSEESHLDQSEGTAGEGTHASQPPGEGGTETPTPATVTAAQTSATRTPDDSDSSTAASHTTSPLFLFLLACAAAAAVVAA
ncbi:Mucin-associated surface protein (MASP) subgroup S008 [Trypanosoma cruzi]|uniref:Mucin-associated surface protein (MASP) subgroup S008 n=1 Tax=Trypanosoma cruzi TaxID=5693 RepID=A0A7J6XJN9_TRYCR|nr:Mucin-associated surface protein (MASP) subgroup S008 [Trypanosoma cruzi]